MFWILTGMILLADRLLKIYIVGHFSLHESHPIIAGMVSLLYVQNRGAAFSILSGQKWLLLGISILTICGILWYRHRHPLKRSIDMALGCVVGGALGNMIDRIYWGYVVDYISVGWWPVFNLADIAIVCGGAWLFLGIVFESRAEEKP